MCVIGKFVKHQKISKSKARVAYRNFNFNGFNKTLESVYYYTIFRQKIEVNDVKPQPYSGAGFWCFQNKKKMESYPGGIGAKIKIFGDCIEHENGWRAEAIEIMEVYVPLCYKKSFVGFKKKNPGLRRVKIIYMKDNLYER